MDEHSEKFNKDSKYKEDRTELKNTIMGMGEEFAGGRGRERNDPCKATETGNGEKLGLAKTW